MGDYGPDAGCGRPEPRPAGQRRVEHRQAGRQLRLAVLHRRERRLQRLRLRHEHVRADVRLRRARSTTRRTTPACATCRRPSPRRLVGYGETDTRFPRARAPAARPMAARSTTTTPTSTPTQVPARTTTASGSSSSGTTAGSRRELDARRARRPRSTADPCTNTFPGGDYLRPMDMEFGPDGSLYVIEWGAGFGGNNADSGIYRIDYTKGARRPIAARAAHAGLGPGAAVGAVLLRRHLRPRGHAARPTRGTSTRRHDRLDRPEPGAHLPRRRQLQRAS